MDDFAHNRNVTPVPPGVETLDWQTKVKDMLPDDWELQDEWASEKTSFRDALSHVTGMPRDVDSHGPGDTTEGVVRNLRNLRPAYELRQKWSYNKQMYMLGAYLTSEYTNGAYTDFASERLFAPMNISRTTFWSDEARKQGRRQAGEGEGDGLCGYDGCGGGGGKEEREREGCSGVGSPR